MNSLPSTKAWARPLGTSWTLYESFSPSVRAVAEERLEPRQSIGVEMIRISRMPASISVESG